MHNKMVLPDWKRRSDELIRAALLLSAVAHLIVMLYWKMPLLLDALEGQVVLTVILQSPQHAPKPEVAPAPLPVAPEPKKEEALLPARIDPVKAEVPAPPVPVPASRYEQSIDKIAPVVENQPADEKLEALPADPVIENRQVQKASQAQALVVIGEDGTVRQIIWKQLPAVTEEELRQMELHLRQQAYLARGVVYTMPETIEIPRN